MMVASSHHVGDNNSYQAVIAKYHMAWQDIKQYPNTCNYSESTESQLWLIVCSGFTAKDAFDATGDHDWPCCSCMENNDERIFSTILQISHRMLQGKKKIFL